MFSSRALSALLFLQSVLSPTLAATSSSFKIQHLDGRTWKYDAAKDVIRLNSGYEMTLAAVDDTSVYGNSQGLVALLNTAASTYVRHAGFILHSNAFSGNNYDFAWQFQERIDGNCLIYNDYGGGYYVGYDASSDSVLIVSQTDSRKLKWSCPPSSTGVLTNSLTNERQLSQSWYYDTVDVPVNYRISFDIKSLGLIGGWGSILHYSKNNVDCCSPGNRMPAVWTIPGSNNLHVRIGSTTDGNWGLDTAASIPVGQYVNVIINAYGNRVQVSINGVIQDAVMPSDRVSGPALLYLADPWYASANALIKNYQMTTSPGLLTRPNLTAERQLSFGWLYDTVTVPENYRISFDIKMIGIIGGWGSIFHYTKDNIDCCSPGNRMPAIWIIPGSNRLHVRFGSQGDGNWGFDTGAGLPIGQYSNVIINAYGNRVQVVIDGQIQEAFMPSSRISGPALFYMADPFYASANAMVKNYAISAASGPILGSLTDERQLSQSWYYDTVDVPVNYRISFDIKSLGLIGGWGSILHYSKNNVDCCSPGNRMPAVWTIPGSNNLHVRIGSTTDGNWGLDTAASIPVGQYVNVIINAYGNRVQVSINGVIQDAVMPSDRVSGPALLYLADPWYASANALIKNYQMTTSPGLLTRPNLTAERQLSFGWLYDTVTVPENYRISFDIKMIGIIGGWGSIFHYTKDNIDCCSPGNRMPAIWIIPGSNRLHVRFGSQGDGNWGFDTGAGLPIGQYSNVIINAYGNRVQVVIDGQIQEAFMPSSRISGPALFYMADPFYASANAMVKNYAISAASGPILGSLTDERQLSQSWYYDTVDVPVNYRISFDIKSLGLIGGWGSILHYSKNNVDCCSPGNRMPAVWTIPGSNNLHVRIGSTTDGNWGLDTAASIPVGQYVNVIINAYGNRVQVSINGVIQDAVMPSDRVSGPALLYLADPWYASANALIKNYQMTTSPGLLTRPNLTAERQLSFGWLYDTVTVPENYRISFDIKMIGIIGGWGSIFHYTKDNIDCCSPGNRMPAIWIIPGSNRLHVRFGSQGDGNWGFDTGAGLPIGQYSNVIINAYGNRVQVVIDGQIQEAFMPSSRISGPALFYMADPFYASANAMVKNYEIYPSSGVWPLQNVAQGSLIRNWPTGDLYKVDNGALRPFAFNDFAASGYPKIVNINDDTWFASMPRGPAVPATPHSNRLLVLYHAVVADNILNLGEMTFYDASGSKVAVSVDKFMASDTNKNSPLSNLIDGDPNTQWHTTWTPDDGVDYSKQQHWLRVDLTSYPSITRVVITNRVQCCQARIDDTVVSYLNGAKNTTIKFTPVSNRASYELWLSRADNGMIWNSLGSGQVPAPPTTLYSIDGWKSSNILTTWTGSASVCKTTCLSTGCKAFSYNAASGNCLLHSGLDLVQDPSYTLYFSSGDFSQVGSSIEGSSPVNYSTVLMLPFSTGNSNQFVSISLYTVSGTNFTVTPSGPVIANSTLIFTMPGNLNIDSISLVKSSTSAGSAQLDMANISFNGTKFSNSQLLLSGSVIDNLQSQNKYSDVFNVLSGQLADGTYILKWPSADFDFSSACQISTTSASTAKSVCVKLVNIDPANSGLIQAEVIFTDGSKTLLTPQALNRNMFVSFKSDQDIQSFTINYYGNDTSTAAVDINSVVVSNNLIAPDSLCNCTTLPLSTQFSIEF